MASGFCLRIFAYVPFLLARFCTITIPAEVPKIEESLFNLTLNLQEARSPSPAGDATENLLLSPLGFSLVLGQIAAGANPVLREAIGGLLGWNEDTDDLTNIHTYHENILRNYSAGDEESSLQININSALFHRDFIEIRQNFQELVEESYATELIPLAENATENEHQQTVNNWVKNVTKDIIQTFPISAKTISLFANVVYFNAEWEEPFSDQLTRPGKFFPTADKTTNATYLQGQQEIPYMENKELDFKMIRMPYKSSKFNMSMYILAPQKHNLQEIIQNLTLSKFLEYRDQMSVKTVNLKIPKVSLKSKIQLKGDLEREIKKSLNGSKTISKTFDYFSLPNVSDDSKCSLSNVVQESTFNVYEKGTTFAALTAGYINYDGTAKNCRVDKPYLSIIMDDSNNIMLFWARIYHPSV
ncbi:hypothetical protein DMENIID0001_120730 [Sergentomyia squamirostris]